jgi:predicted DNA-binding transcriptional regulator AlpA
MNEPIAISLTECARLLSVTRKHVYTLIDTDPDFPRTFWLGRCRRVMKSEVLQYIANKAKRPEMSPVAERLREPRQRAEVRTRVEDRTAMAAARGKGLRAV